MPNYNSSVLLFAITFILVLPECCYGAMLRGNLQSRSKPYTNQHDRPKYDQRQHSHRFVMTNACMNNVRIHTRHFDGELKHTLFDTVQMNQAIELSTHTHMSTDSNTDSHTPKQITAALVALELDGKDHYAPECALGTKGYIQYSDGFCYKFYYSPDLIITCNNSDGGSSSKYEDEKIMTVPRVRSW